MQKILFAEINSKAKPFLKWAGGKAQLLKELSSRLPSEIIKTHIIERYIEPFVGSGALFFYLKNNFDVKESYLFDINRELIIGYKVIQTNHQELIKKLFILQDKYLINSQEERMRFYYKIRASYNKQILNFDYENCNKEWIDRATYLIFLNKTCYNGLFRQNKKGEFNVPFGRYKNPKICDERNIITTNAALKNTKIFFGDFTKSDKYINNKSFIYFDPPYRPISETSNFTAYSNFIFDDEQQKKLSVYFKKMHERGAKLMLSNSDPKNIDSEDDFFDRLYTGFIIERVPAKRYINCDAAGRGAINELIIRNYEL